MNTNYNNMYYYKYLERSNFKEEKDERMGENTKLFQVEKRKTNQFKTSLKASNVKK